MNAFQRALKYFFNRPIIVDDTPPDYVYPSKRTLELLEKGIQSAKDHPPVYRDEDFSKYADDE